MEAVDEVGKKRITPILKGMKVDDNTCYPIERYTSVSAAIQVVKYKAKHKRFSMKKKGDIVCVTRTE